MITKEQSLTAAIRVISQLQENEYYGVLSLQFQKGNIVLFRNEQTVVPADMAKQGAGLLVVRCADGQ